MYKFDIIAWDQKGAEYDSRLWNNNEFFSEHINGFKEITALGT